MHVYLGKLKWSPYGEDETFTIILPHGPVRVGDPVYLFFQWTIDAKGVKKPNWFQNLLVDSVTKNSSGDDVFVLQHHYYKWEITAQQSYSKLSVVMSNPSNFKSTMSFDCFWQSKGEQSTDTGRIWTGKINWMSFANNEAAIIIVPEGFGEGKPVISIWQWSQSSAGRKNDTSPRLATQQMDARFGKGIKFTFTNYYTLTCTWDEKTEKLDVKMAEGGSPRDLGEFTLAARIDRHKHDWNPSEPTPEKAELEVRLPQAQSSLPRIMTPMPFPRTLIETLAHTAAFVDQAGYLAKYAEERYNALDADFHLRGDQLDAAKTENGELKNNVKTLNDEVSVEKAKAADLATSLKAARDQAAAEGTALNEKIKELQDYISKDKAHDDQELAILEKTRQELEAERAAKNDLKKELDAALLKLKETATRLDNALAKIASLEARIKDLENQLALEATRYAALEKENTTLGAQVKDLTSQLKKVRARLAITEDEAKQSKEDVATLETQNKKLVEDKNYAENKTREKEAELDELDKRRKRQLEELEKQLKELTEE